MLVSQDHQTLEALFTEKQVSGWKADEPVRTSKRKSRR
jgi:hypothetical protein